MNNLFHNGDSTHWYQADGTPLHTVLSSKGEPRQTTLRDARKLGLLPSVTNILGVIAKPELTAYLQRQVAESCLTLPRLPGEGEDAFILRVVEDAAAHSEAARKFGTDLHAACAAVADRRQPKPLLGLQAWEDHFANWLQKNVGEVLGTELPKASRELGFAGCLDLCCWTSAGFMIVDIKSQGIKPSAKPNWYPEWCYQLAAYRQLVEDSKCRCMNLVFNSLAPEPPIERYWTEEELANGWEAFKAAQTIWQIGKGYWPNKADSCERKEVTSAV